LKTSGRVLRCLKGGIAAAALLATGMSAAHAALTSFTSKAAFDLAISGFAGTQTLDFESVAAGTTFASGAGTGGLAFTYSIAGPSTLQVSSVFGTTSGSNYLGLDNPDTAFYLGDSFDITFSSALHAVGLYVITGSDAQAGDIQLSAAGGAVSNSATPDTLVSDGQAFYLGLVESDPLGFTSVTVSGLVSGGAFLAFTVDDITTSPVSAIPEPEGWAMLLAGLGLLALRRRRSTTSKSSN
jgi:PEP-CTERM motif-containing protein